jgi:hypothetical protein
MDGNDSIGYSVTDSSMAEDDPIKQAAVLLPGESADLKTDIIETVGEEWLHAKDIWLQWRTPEQLVGTKEEYKIRDILRSVTVAALS